MQDAKIGGICIVTWVLLVLLTGCSAERTFYTYAAKNPDKVAKFCTNVYQADTVYKQGATITNTDTLTVKGDSVPCPDKPAGVKTVYVKCPDAKIITKTISRIDTAFRDRITTLAQLDTAKLAVNTARDKQILAEQSRNNWKTTALWAIGILAAFALFTVFKSKILGVFK